MIQTNFNGLSLPVNRVSQSEEEGQSTTDSSQNKAVSIFKKVIDGLLKGMVVGLITGVFVSLSGIIWMPVVLLIDPTVTLLGMLATIFTISTVAAMVLGSIAEPFDYNISDFYVTLFPAVGFLPFV